MSAETAMLGSMKPRCRSILTLFLAILTIPTAAAYEFVRDVNFTLCQQKIQARNASDCAQDELQICVWDRTGSYLLDPSRVVLTLDGCERLCGKGYELWPAKETLSRVFLWVVPAIVLLVHFHFAPLSAGNTCAVVVQLIGNPIDSIWSMLTRQEVNRRLRRRGQDLFDRTAGSVATIWATYDELGWQEASEFTKRRMERVSGASLDERESYLIERASYRLSCSRSETSLGTWAAILGLFAALLAAFIRTWIYRLSNQTSHTIAVVMLLSYFIPMVKISGNIGAFVSSTAAMDILQELRRDLETYSADPLFPPIQFQEASPWNSRLVEDSEKPRSDRTNVTRWPSVASYLGMNSPWRPCKTVPIVSPSHELDRGSKKLLLISMTFVVAGSWAPAFYLSYHTGNAGVGCRCLAWTFVLFCWLISLLLDQLKHFNLRRWTNRELWRYTVLKDSIVCSIVIAIIVCVQLGLLNTCWCLSGVIYLGRRHARVDLGPVTDEQWAGNWFHWSIAPAVGLLDWDSHLRGWVRRRQFQEAAVQESGRVAGVANAIGEAEGKSRA